MLLRDDDRTESYILWQKQHLLELFKKRRITTNMQISAQGKKPAKSPIPLDPLNSKYAGHRQKPSKKQTNQVRTNSIFPRFQKRTKSVQVTCTGGEVYNAGLHIWQEGRSSPRPNVPKIGRTPFSTDAPEEQVVMYFFST